MNKFPLKFMKIIQPALFVLYGGTALAYIIGIVAQIIELTVVTLIATLLLLFLSYGLYNGMKDVWLCQTDDDWQKLPVLYLKVGKYEFKVGGVK